MKNLCKGKRTDNGEWILGQRIDDDVTGQVFIHAQGNSVNESDKVNEEGLLSFVAFEVIPETVSMCIGRKDKMGQIAFENDIIYDIDYQHYAVLIWDEEDLSYGAKYEDQTVDFGDYPESAFEIRGNIFDNKDFSDKILKKNGGQNSNHF